MKHLIGSLILIGALFLTGCQSGGAQHSATSCNNFPNYEHTHCQRGKCVGIISIDADQTRGQECCSTSGSLQRWFSGSLLFQARFRRGRRALDHLLSGRRLVQQRSSLRLALEQPALSDDFTECTRRHASRRYLFHFRSSEPGLPRLHTGVYQVLQFGYLFR